jgi:hypothetical protein
MTAVPYAVAVAEIDGQRVLSMSRIEHTSSPELAAALARRRRATATGRCECGAVMVLPNREARRAAARTGRVPAARMEHEVDCPCDDDSIRRLRSASLS